MTRGSLRLRLLAGAVLAVFAALAVAWAVMTVLFERHIEQRMEAELKADALQIVGALRREAGRVVLSRRPSDPRFDRAAGGLYWEVSGTGVQLRSRSLWDRDLPGAKPSREGWASRIVPGPFGGDIVMLERRIDLGGLVLDVQLAQDARPLAHARDEFARELAIFLLVLWLVLAAAAWAQVHLGLKPLSRLRRDLAALRQNPAERLNAVYPAEIEPLTAAINELASAREADLKRARQRAADLAHALKTPLAALSAQSRLVREGTADTARADGLDRAIAAAAAAVEAELARARAASARRETAEAAPLAVAEKLVGVLERTEKGMRVDCEIDLAEDMRLRMSEADLNEVLGPLLENGVRFAHRRVRLTSPGPMALRVEDDGPGIAEDRAALALLRGGRLDEAAGGHGLGLAIARDLVEATGGSMSLGVSALGGLSVDLVWPV